MVRKRSWPWNSCSRIARCRKIWIVEGSAEIVSASDFQQGLSEQLPPGKARKSVIPTTTAAGLMNKNNLLIIGVADSIKVDHGSGGNLIHIEGRDLRGVLLDAKLRPDQLANVDLSNDIVQVVTDIVALHPLMGSVNVVGQESDWPNSQIPSPGVAGDLTKVNTVMTTAASSSGGSAGNGRARAGGGAGQDWTMWDAITKYCYIVGAIPFFQGEDLWIRPAYGLYEYQTNPNHYPNVPVPFAGGRSRQALPHPNYRCMVYGRNILSLKLDRKLGGVKTPCVEVVCTDTSSTTRGKGRLLVERWPDTPPATSVEPSGDASHLDVMRVPVHGINNPTRLKEIAHQIFEEVARGEITGSIETKDLSSFAGNNDDADLLRLRPGDPIEIVVNADNPLDEYPVVNDVSAWEVSQSQQVKMLTDKLGDKDLAQAIVDTRSGKVADLQRTFRVNAVKFGWEAGSGVAVDFDFHNYIETRFDQSQTAPATTTATQQTAPGGSAASMRRIAMAAFGDSPSAKRIASAAFGPSPSGAPSLPDPTEATTPNPKGTT